MADEYCCSSAETTPASSAITPASVSSPAGQWMPRAAGVCHTQRMNAVALLDRDAIARACRQFGVARLRVFGSAVTDDFDPARSDFDFFVDFQPQVADLLGTYLGLSAELARITGRKVDLVMTDAVENPYFAAQAARGAQDLYAA